MKVVVQHVETGRFYRDNNAWAEKADLARGFSNSFAALDFCQKHQLRKVQVVLKFQDQRFDLAFPLVAS